MARAIGVISIALLAALACKDRAPSPAGGEQAAEPPEPPLPRGPRPALAGAVVRVENPSGLATLARPIIAVPDTRDGVGLVLHWEDAKTGRIGADHPLGVKAVSWPQTVSSVRVKVRPSGTDEWRQLSVGGSAPNLATPPLSEGATLMFTIDAAGLQVASRTRPWAEPPAALFDEPGSYELQVAGSLALESEPLAFETGIIPVTVTEPKTLPPAELEDRAAQRIARHRKLDAPPRVARPTVDDAAGNRVVRFTPLIGRHPLDIEVVMAPDGEIVAVTEERAGSIDQDAWFRMWRRPGGVP